MGGFLYISPYQEIFDKIVEILFSHHNLEQLFGNFS